MQMMHYKNVKNSVTHHLTILINRIEWTPYEQFINKKEISKQIFLLGNYFYKTLESLYNYIYLIFPLPLSIKWFKSSQRFYKNLLMGILTKVKTISTNKQRINV